MALEHESAMVIEFACDEHPIEAYKRAAYTLMNRVTCSVQPNEQGVRCVLEPVSKEPPDGLIRDFRREVLDQDLRISIESKTENLRNLILGLAFSRVGRDDEIR